MIFLSLPSFKELGLGLEEMGWDGMGWDGIGIGLDWIGLDETMACVGVGVGVGSHSIL